MAQQGPNRSQRRRQERSQQEKRSPTQVETQFVKSNFCRVIHADGAFGGPTPHGSIYMALFSEHNKLPDSQRYTLDLETHTLLQEPTRQGSRVWTREVEVEVILTVDFARALRDWLDDKIQIATNPEAKEKLTIQLSSTEERET